MNAVLSKSRSAVWAALRVWAAQIRDSKSAPIDDRLLAITLVSVLDSYEILGREDLWATCLVAAQKLVETGRYTFPLS